MARTSTGVRFVLKNPKAKVSPIKIIFCYANTQMYYYERKLSIQVKHWNKVAQRAKEKSDFEESSEFNSTLNAIQSTILSCYRKYKNDFGTEPTRDELRELVKIQRGTIQKTVRVELLDFITQFIAEAKQGKYFNMANGKPVASVTIRTYEQTLKLLIEFSKKSGHNLCFNDINTIFHKEFVHFLTKEFKSKETQSHLKINTVGKHLTNLKTFMSAAIERKLTENNDFKSKNFKVIRENVDKIYLNEKEIQVLENFDLSNNKRLEKVRDMFIIGCYTALRISDLKSLTKQHIVKEEDGWYIKIEMQKTEKPVTIPVTEKLRTLLEKYETSTGEYFPKAISSQKANEYIKEVAEMIEEFKTEVVINSTVKGHRVSKSIPKYKLIENHTARRSFATNAAARGIPYQFIMPITGHKTEKSFLRYIKLEGMDSAKLFKLKMEQTALKVV